MNLQDQHDIGEDIRRAERAAIAAVIEKVRQQVAIPEVEPGDRDFNAGVDRALNAVAAALLETDNGR